MSKLDHIHQYVRATDKVYRCSHPACFHKMPKIYLKGKLSLCDKCFKEFTLDEYALRRKKPKCQDCRGGK